MNISIITPCTRIDNLVLLLKSITFPCNWYIIFDAEKVPNADVEHPSWIHTDAVKGGVSGNLQRNRGLDLITDPETWVYFLDDDTIIHPDFYKEVEKFTTDFPQYSAWVFNQLLKDGSERWATQQNIGVYRIDQAQYLLKRKFIGRKRFEQKYEADGILIEQLYKEDPRVFGYWFKTICYYNYLR